MNDVLVLVGSGIAILLGIVHFASTKPTLQGFKDLPVNETGMLHAIWHGVGFMLLFLGGCRWRWSCWESTSDRPPLWSGSQRPPSPEF